MVAQILIAPCADNTAADKTAQYAQQKPHFWAVHIHRRQARIGVAPVIQHFRQFDAQIGGGTGHVGGTDDAAGKHGQHGVVHAHDERQQPHGRMHQRPALVQAEAEQAEKQQIQRFQPHRHAVAAAELLPLCPQNQPTGVRRTEHERHHARHSQQCQKPLARV